MAERSFHRLRRCCLLVVIALMVVLPSPSAAVGVNLLRNMFRNPPTNTRAPQMFLNPFTVDTKTDQRVSAWERLWNPEEQQINLAAKAQGKPPPNIPRQEIPTDDQLPNTKYLADPQNILKNPYLLIRSEGVAPPGQQGKAGSDTEGFGTGQHDHTHVAPPAGASNHTASAQTPTGGSAPTTEHPAASTPAAAAEQQVVADAVHSATASMNPLLTMMAARLNMSVTTTPSGALTAAGTQPSQQQAPAASGPCALVKYTNTKFTGEALLVASAFVAKLNIMNALATSHNLTIMVLKTASEGSVATPKDNHIDLHLIDGSVTYNFERLGLLAADPAQRRATKAGKFIDGLVAQGLKWGAAAKPVHFDDGLDSNAGAYQTAYTGTQAALRSRCYDSN